MAWNFILLFVHNVSTLSIFIARGLNFSFFHIIIVFLLSNPLLCLHLMSLKMHKYDQTSFWGAARSNTVLFRNSYQMYIVSLPEFLFSYLCLRVHLRCLVLKPAPRNPWHFVIKQNHSWTNICSEPKISHATSLNGITRTFSPFRVPVSKLTKAGLVIGGRYKYIC